MRGATGEGKEHGDKNRDFNPRTRKGCDEYSFRLPCYSFLISIHAPHAGCDAAS